MRSLALAAFILSAVFCSAQQTATNSGLAEFFSGNWGCAGEFANGRKIEADISFTPELDGKWIVYRHDDRPPGPFKALAMWGVDQPSGKTISTMHDNFGNARLFLSDGWKDGAIVFTRAQLVDQRISEERFRYERQSLNSFKMTYERVADGKWKMGDFLLCARK